MSGGRMDEGEMERLFAGEDALVVDATHPYASAVTENIRSACEKTGRTYLRVLRSSTLTGEEEAVYVDSPEAAAEYLAGTEGNIFLTTGSKELPAFRAVPDYENRIFARVLPLPEVVKSCAELGFQGKHLICMQGPFSQEAQRGYAAADQSPVSGDQGYRGGRRFSGKGIRRGGGGLPPGDYRPSSAGGGYEPGRMPGISEREVRETPGRTSGRSRKRLW